MGKSVRGEKKKFSRMITFPELSDGAMAEVYINIDPLVITRIIFSNLEKSDVKLLEGGLFQSRIKLLLTYRKGMKGPFKMDVFRMQNWNLVHRPISKLFS